MNIKLNPLNLLPVVLAATSLVTLGACQERTALLVKDSSTSIALERTGLDGEYDPSGLAKRVAKVFSEDPTFKPTFRTSKCSIEEIGRIGAVKTQSL